MSDAEYCYPPAYTVLRNKLELRDAAELDRMERLLVRNRTMEGLPRGDFDLAHLKAIHKHLFQDVYDWAGEIRTVELSKGGNQFQLQGYLETGVAHVHQRIVDANYFQGSSPDRFAAQAGQIIGDLNYAHPFREGNGRTQLQFLKQLGEKAGHEIDLERLDRDRWIEASKRAHEADYEPMARCIGETIVSERVQERERPDPALIAQARDMYMTAEEKARYDAAATDSQDHATAEFEKIVEERVARLRAEQREIEVDREPQAVSREHPERDRER